MAKKHSSNKEKRLIEDAKNKKRIDRSQLMDYVGIVVILLIAAISIYYAVSIGGSEKMKEKVDMKTMLSQAVEESLEFEGKLITYYFFIAPESKICSSDAIIGTELKPEDITFDFSRLVEESGAMDGLVITEEGSCIESVSEKDQYFYLFQRCVHKKCDIIFSTKEY